MSKPHGKTAFELLGTGGNAVAITPSDSTDLVTRSRALFVGGAGNLNVRMAGGMDCVFTSVTAGTLLPIQVDRVYATSTTATNIVAVY